MFESQNVISEQAINTMPYTVILPLNEYGRLYLYKIFPNVLASICDNHSDYNIPEERVVEELNNALEVAYNINNTDNLINVNHIVDALMFSKQADLGYLFNKYEQNNNIVEFKYLEHYMNSYKIFIETFINDIISLCGTNDYNSVREIIDGLLVSHIVDDKIVIIY